MAGKLWSWGYNGNGELGDNTIVSKSSPIQSITYGSDWKNVACGYYTPMAIKTDGTLWCWGDGSNGALGNNNTNDVSSPVQTVAGGTNWAKISSGTYYDHSFAIKNDGTLWGWGYNDSGELGTGETANKSSPVQTICGGTNWRDIASGGRHTAAIKTDGTLWCWGDNSNGNLGNNNTTNVSSPVQTVTGGTNWKQVSSGERIVFAIKTDGTLWGWGEGNNGQLGNNSTLDVSSPIQTVCGGTNWKSVSCGNEHVAAIKNDGTLWMWGYNNFGQLGNDNTSSISSPIQTICGGNNWKTVSCGFRTTAAIKNDGTLWLWGEGGDGQLGNDSELNISSPVQTVMGGNNWVSVATGYLSTFAIEEVPTQTVVKSCANEACGTTVGFSCVNKSSNVCTCATWRFFFPQCTRANIVSGTCNGRAGAYVAAITVCNQNLF